MSYHYLNSDSQQLVESLNFIEPQNYDQATSHLGWQQVVDKELQALEQIKT